MLAAIAISLAVLWRALDGGFVYDDIALVQRNPSLQSWSSFADALFGPYWEFVRPEGGESTVQWRPLTMTVLFLGGQLGASQPWAFHAVAFVLHASCIALVFRFAERWLGGVLPAFATALLFGVHPLVVESTAWISAVNDPLAALGLFAAAVSYLSWRERGSHGLPLGAAAWFFVGLLGKESAAAWLLLAPLIDFVARDGVRWRAHATFAATFALYFLARCAAFRSPTGGLDLVSAHLELPWPRELSFRVEMFGGYLGLLFAPLHLNLFRDVRPAIAFGDREFWTAVVWIVAWSAATAFAWRKRERGFLLALLWIPAALSPLFVEIEALGRCAISERFAYIALAGAALAFGALIARVKAPIVAWTLTLAVAALAAWKSRDRVAFWRDEETMFRGAVEASPNSPYVYWGLGRVLLDRFRRTLEFDTLDGALRAFSRSQDLGAADEKGVRDETVLVTVEDRLQANVGYAWCVLLCETYVQSECWGNEAEPLFRTIVERFPDSAEAHTGLGVALAQRGDLPGAIAELEHATVVNPKSSEAWFNHGSILARAGRLDEAVRSLEHAHAIDPTDPEIAIELARALADSGRVGDADTLLASLRERASKNADVWLVSGVVAARERRLADGLAFVDRALQLNGLFGEAHLEKAKILYELAQLDRAFAEFGRACELLPSSFEAHYQCGRVLFALGAKAEALPYFERALALAPDGKFVEELRPKLEEAKAAAASEPKR
ncbi:MAG: tetratricopeptide repeat protein [Planctomycetes bacterium]|nr:tetratricopeptide repeat protein [Planctomycetota bacterium]